MKREAQLGTTGKENPNPDHVASVPITFESFSPEQTSIAQYKSEADPKELTIAQKNLKTSKPFNGIKVPQFQSFVSSPRTREEILLSILGSYLSHGDQVHAGFPTALFDAPEGVSAPSRLDFAKWIMDPNNPLTPRVTANRFGKTIRNRFSCHQ